MLELQVALVLLSFGIATLSSLTMSQERIIRKVRGDFVPDAKLYLTQSPDPWVKKLEVSAQVTASELSLLAPTPVAHPQNEVTIVSKTQTLTGETITATVDTTPVD
jgi:hypothetical protein